VWPVGVYVYGCVCVFQDSHAKDTLQHKSVAKSVAIDAICCSACCQGSATRGANVRLKKIKSACCLSIVKRVVVRGPLDARSGGAVGGVESELKLWGR